MLSVFRFGFRLSTSLLVCLSVVALVMLCFHSASSALAQSINHALYLPNIVHTPTLERIAFSAGGDIYITDARGGTVTNITGNPANEFRNYWYNVDSWSLEDQIVRFIYGTDANVSLMTVRPDGSNAQTLAVLEPRSGGVRWSANGNKLLVQEYTDTPPIFEGELLVMNTNGSGAQSVAICSGGCLDYEWSPDGNKIAFTALGDGNTQSAFVVNANGGNLIEIAGELLLPMQPQWSPDSHKLLLTSTTSLDANGNDEIYVVNADGTGLANLTNASGNDFGPQWSPDGSQIAFSTYRNDGWYIYVMNSDGSNQRQLSPDAGFYQNLQWSPSGKNLAFINDYEVLNGAATNIIIPETQRDLGVLAIETLQHTRLTFGLEPESYVWAR